MEMHERIRELRKNYLHLSQTQFGEKLGVSRSVIKNIELNTLARPEQKLSLIKLMCKEFNVREEWLINGTGDMFNSMSQDEELAYVIGATLSHVPDHVKSAFIAFGKISKNLSPEDWTMIQKIIDAIAENKKQH